VLSGVILSDAFFVMLCITALNAALLNVVMANVLMWRLVLPLC
jgi:hypothetical protein